MSAHPKVAAEAQKAEFSPFVVLYRVDATALGAGVLCFTQSAGATAPISFGGTVYTPIDVACEGFEWNGTGALPTPRIRVGNINRAFSALVGGYRDLLGAQLTRIRTFSRFLDGQPEADGTAFFPPDVYKFERKTIHTKEMIEWELSAAMDQEGRMLPGRQILRDACTHGYRAWTGTGFDYSRATCPYVGARYFRANGQETGVPGEDRCGKRLSDCRDRFGADAALPTRAFPGVARIRY